MVIALAGRRIDKPGAFPPLFPLENMAEVRRCIKHKLEDYRPDWLVSSAACGADLLGLEAARSLQIKARVILPFERSLFRDLVVTARPGEWADLFDSVVDAASATGNLINLNLPPVAFETFLTVNSVIFEHAESLQPFEHPSLQARDAPNIGAIAIIVWNGEARPDNDVTFEFKREAMRRCFPIVEIPTL